ncbi:MAG: GNAT family N-acetyltransferase [Ponticaulis sp.]|nr:GNAT family N-acetyltransferase [Ponticaulis sp.]
MKDLSGYTPRPLPGTAVLEGRFVRLEPWETSDHGTALGEVVSGPDAAHLWTYLPFEGFDTPDAFAEGFTNLIKQGDWNGYAILDQETGQTIGTASYMRQRPADGSIEVGCVLFSPKLQKTSHATEAIWLMAHHVFEDLGYRRFEWKCDNLNLASKRAALRFGFRYEGIFRNDRIVKGRNRDTAWFAMTDDDWPEIDRAFRDWLAPSNFSSNGQQIRKLAAQPSNHIQNQQ